jgi:hypothetical protein
MRFLGFVVGFAVTAFLEYVLLHALGRVPRGLGWVVLPIAAGISFSSATPALIGRFSRADVENIFFSLSRGARGLAIGCGIWLLAVPVYVYLFQPYDDSLFDMYSDDYFHMLKVMVFPVGLAVIGYVAYIRFVIGEHREQLERAPVAPPDPPNYSKQSQEDYGSQQRNEAAIEAIECGVASFQVYDLLIRALGGRIEPKGIIFDAHYLVTLDGHQFRVERMEGLREWFLANVVDKFKDQVSRGQTHDLPDLSS